MQLYKLALLKLTIIIFFSLNSFAEELELLGEYDTLGQAIDVHVISNTAYVADGNNGLQVIDVDNPSLPQLLGSYSTSEASSVYPVGSTVYLADGSNGLRIIDVSDPSSPQILGTYNTPGSAINVHVSDDIAYVADNTGGLQIIDVSDPENPELFYSFNTGSEARDIYVANSIAYVAVWDVGLEIIDVTIPSSPTLLTTYSIDDTLGVYVSGNIAYIAGFTYGLKALDISNPSSPVLISSFSIGKKIANRGLYVHNNKAYVATYEKKLKVVNFNDSSSPELIGEYDSSESLGVYATDDFIYLADGNEGLKILQFPIPKYGNIIVTTNVNSASYTISGPDVYSGLGMTWTQSDALTGDYTITYDKVCGYTTPISETITLNEGETIEFQGIYIEIQQIEPLGEYDTLGQAIDVHVISNTAYVADGNNGLQVINVSNPCSPQLFGSYSTSEASSVYPVGSTVYLADGSNGLRIIDVSDPSSPQILGTYNTPGSAINVHVSDDIAYVADNTGGLQIIDVSDPENPTLLSSFNTGSEARDIYVVNSIAYVAVWDVGLEIIDVTIPSSPTLLTTYSIDDTLGVYVSGNIAYIAGFTYGLKALHISNPSSPVLISSFSIGKKIANRGLYVHNNKAYVATYEKKLKVVNFNDSSSPELIGEYDSSESLGVYATDDFIYLADGNEGLKILFPYLLNNYIIVITNLDSATYTISGPTVYSGSGKSWSQGEVTPGEYTITYDEMDGYVTPPSETKSFEEGEGITFNGKYLKFGKINVTTNHDSATYTISGPTVYSGTGKSWSQDEASPGEYTITYDDLDGYVTPPSETQTLEEGEEIAFSGIYLKFGNINVITNLDSATYTVSGPVVYSGSGKSWSQDEASPGEYTITYDDVDGYVTPPSETQTLEEGEEITFSGVYEVEFLDLKLRNIKLPNKIKRREFVYITTVCENRGNIDSSKCRIEFYLSKNSNRKISNDDILLNVKEVNKIKKGRSKKVILTWGVSSNYDNGAYYIKSKCYSYNKPSWYKEEIINETNEVNNIVVSEKFLIAGAIPTAPKIKKIRIHPRTIYLFERSEIELNVSIKDKYGIKVIGISSSWFGPGEQDIDILKIESDNNWNNDTLNYNLTFTIQLRAMDYGKHWLTFRVVNKKNKKSVKKFWIRAK